jgi:outer membrane receptor protein involved in Fe transport
VRATRLPALSTWASAASSSGVGLTLNSGLRFDGVNEYTNETQLSPRMNLVMKATDTTTVHAGYSRYFVPPPFELVTPTAISLFNDTTDAPAVQQDSLVKAKRSHYFDIGLNQIIVPGLTVGLDGYYKLAINLIDEGQFGAPIILAAFNYAKAYVAGGVFTLSYDQGAWSIYGNAAIRAPWVTTLSRRSSILRRMSWLTSCNTTFISIMIRHGPRRWERPTRSTRQASFCSSIVTESPPGIRNEMTTWGLKIYEFGRKLPSAS